MPIQTVEKVIDASKEYFGVKVEPSEKDNEQEPSFGAFSYYDEDEEGSFSSEVWKHAFELLKNYMYKSLINFVVPTFWQYSFTENFKLYLL